MTTTVLTYGVFSSDDGLDVRIIFDHRVIDGATVARALMRLEEMLNGPVAEELRGVAPAGGIDDGGVVAELRGRLQDARAELAASRKLGVHLIAPTATLVARKRTHPALVQLFVLAAQQVHGGAGWFQLLDNAPAPLACPATSAGE